MDAGKARNIPVQEKPIPVDLEMKPDFLVFTGSADVLSEQNSALLGDLSSRYNIRHILVTHKALSRYNARNLQKLQDDLEKNHHNILIASGVNELYCIHHKDYNKNYLAEISSGKMKISPYYQKQSNDVIEYNREKYGVDAQQCIILSATMQFSLGLNQPESRIDVDKTPHSTMQDDASVAESDTPDVMGEPAIPESVVSEMPARENDERDRLRSILEEYNVQRQYVLVSSVNELGKYLYENTKQNHPRY